MAKPELWIIERIKLMRRQNGDGSAANWLLKISPDGKSLFAYNKTDPNNNWLDTGQGWREVSGKVPGWVDQVSWWHEIEHEGHLFQSDDFREEEIEQALEFIRG